MINYIVRLRKRKAISSVVGAFFFLVLMVASFAAILAAFQFQSDMTKTQSAIADKEIKKAQEKFIVTPFTSGGNLHAWIENQGTDSLEIVDIWYIKKTSDFAATRVATSTGNSVPSGSKIDSLASQTIPIGSGSYTVKAVSALGNIRQAELVTGTTEVGTDTLIDKLVAKPSVYAAFPGPLPKNAKSYFALMVANPTNLDMWVNRTSFQLITPGNPGYFDASSVDLTLSTPNTGWDNTPTTIIWKQSGIAGVKVDKYSTYTFKVAVTTSNSITESQINTVNTNTITTFGQFGSTKIDTTSSVTKTCAEPSVFQSSGPATADKIYAVSGSSYQIKTYNVTMQNTEPQGKILAGSKIIVNIPKGFTDITVPVPLPTGFILVDESDLPTTGAISLNDGSSQLRMKITTDITTGTNNYKTFPFSARSPNVTVTKLYLFYIFGIGNVEYSGTGNCGTNVIMGPVAETVVRVTTP